MHAVLMILSAAAILLGVWLLLTLRRLKSQARALNQRIDDARGLPATPKDRSLIGIEILNPFELATRDSRLARPLIAVTPGLIRRIVYRRTTEILVPQLAEHGVLADVKLYRKGDEDVD